MRLLIITLLVLFALSNCGKTDGFNPAKDLNGTWLVQNNNVNNTYYTFYYKNNIGGVEFLTTHNATYNDSVFYSDWASYQMNYFFRVIDGANIEFFETYYIGFEESSYSMGTYTVLSNDEKNIIKLVTKNRKGITLVKTQNF